MSKATNRLIQSKVESLRASLNTAKGIEALPDWCVRNLSSPIDPNQKFSFKHHEWQIQPMSDPSPIMSIRKSSQVGATQMVANLALGTAMLYPASNILYILPTQNFARKWAANRLSPIIKGSKLLSSRLNPEVSNLELKQLGDSFVHILGSQSEIISVPTLAVIVDELNFCNLQKVTTAQSRLTHNEEGKGRYITFSTPTLPDYGVDKEYSQGKQYQYLCKHDVCGKWVKIDPSHCLKVPGFDGTMYEWDKSFFEDETIRPKDAYYKCPSCKTPVTQENLIDPKKRQWVAEYPDREYSSYQVFPTDCAYYSPAPKLLEASKTYMRHADFLNFGCGVPVADPESIVMLDTLDRYAHRNPINYPSAVPMSSGELGNVAVGMDVGKMCHVVVIRNQGGNRYQVLHMERVPQAEARERYDSLLKGYKARKGVVDAMPDATLSRGCVEDAYHGQAFTAFFVRNPPKSSEEFSIDEVESIVKVPRTHMISTMVKALNTGKLSLPLRHDELTLYKQHLGKLRKVTRISDTTGEAIEAWVSSDSEDHYAMATLYALTAAKMMDVSTSQIVLPSASSLVTKAKQGENLQKDHPLRVQYPY